MNWRRENKTHASSSSQKKKKKKKKNKKKTYIDIFQLILVFDFEQGVPSRGFE